MSKVIAVIDDDEAVRDSIAALLTSEGYHVRTHSSGIEFIKDGRMADLGGVVVDHHMDGMTGIEVAERVHRFNRHLLVILIGGNLTSATVDQAVQSGVQEVLAKPFKDEDLLSAIAPRRR